MNERLQRLHKLLTTMHGERALALWRVLTGCTILSQLLTALPQRHFLFGINGVYPLDLARQNAMFGLFSIFDAPIAFELLYVGTIVVAVAWTMGFLLPLSSIVLLVLWRSTFDRLPGLANGGDNLAHLLIIYACFCNIGGPEYRSWSKRWPQWMQELRAMIHNTGLVAIWIQVCIVYFIAGSAKMHGEAWRNGTALYYALSTEMYSSEFIQPLLAAPVLLTFLAYSTVVFQVGFPFLVGLNRHARQVALCIALSFHIGIAVVMGLTSFALFMIAADLTFLSNREVLKATTALRSIRARARHVFERHDNNVKHQKAT